MTARFLTRSATHHELMLLLAVHERGGLALPVTPSELPSGVLEHVPLARLLEGGTLRKETSGDGIRIVLSEAGMTHLRMLVVDYHLELMELRRTSDAFMAERVAMLASRGCRRVLLYGASDTAQVLLEFLRSSPIEVLGVIDDDPAKQGTLLGGVPIVAASDASRLPVDSIVVTTVAFQDEILRKGRGLPGPGKRFIGLFDDYRE